VNWIRKHISLLGIILYMLVTLSLVSGKMNNVLCENVNININDSLKAGFIEPQEVVNLLKTMEVKLWGYPVYDIPAAEVENVVKNNMPFAEDVCAWADVHGDFHIDLTQRNPIARVVLQDGQSYYIGEKGYLLPLSPNYSSRVLVVSGDVFQKIPGNGNITIDSLVRIKGPENTMIDEIYEMAAYINQDSLLKRQIEQIFVKQNEFELIPKVGTHTIEFGSVDDLLNKFFKLKVIYYKGFSNLGWNKYSRVNLKYKNQVVCTKR